LAAIRPDDLAALPIRALMRLHPALDWAALDDVVLGCANQAGEDNRNVARMAALLAGLPEAVPGATINRLCGSGMDAVAIAARSIAAAEADLVLAGGVESMTRAPFVMGKAGEAFSRSAEIYDTTIGWRFVNALMQAQYGTDSMPETAENVAEAFQISRADQDRFALRSQQRAKAAQDAGVFAREIAPLTLRGRKGDVVIETDEHPRPDTTIEALAKLKTPFRSPGTVTAGNASGVNDGAAALLLASEEGARRHGLSPRARVVAMATAGVEPRMMGIGPAPATRRLLDRAGLTVADIDVIELNEAFAVQVLACLADWGIDAEDPRLNPRGSGISIGHPIGATGLRMLATLAHELPALDAELALETMCIGGGQALAAVFERV
jgi:3-oxoadipyl-CoA thiolase